MTALVLGTVLALAALAYVLAPLFTDVAPRSEVSFAARGDAGVESADERAPGSRVCATCGPRPESDAMYCSSCGRWLGEPCANCGAELLEAGARFCSACGHHVATR